MIPPGSDGARRLRITIEGDVVPCEAWSWPTGAAHEELIRQIGETVHMHLVFAKSILPRPSITVELLARLDAAAKGEPQ